MQGAKKTSIIVSSMKHDRKTSLSPVQAQVISDPFPATASHNVEPVQSPAQTGQATTSVSAADSPTPPQFAADNDLIEKVWVEAVVKMSHEHGDDPFTLQQKQAELTRDYLKKRFGRDIKAS